MKRIVAMSSLLAVLLLALGRSAAEEAYHKYRVSLSLSDQSTSGGIQSNADNTATFPRTFGGVEVSDDPRPDEASQNQLSINDGGLLQLGISYGIWKWKWGEMTIDSSFGRMTSKTGDLEIGAQFSNPNGGGVDPPNINPCGEVTKYHAILIPLGQITEYPLRVGATIRFRPRATGGPIRGMNPYLGFGIGYLFVSLDPSNDFIAVSQNLTNSTGAYLYAIGDGRAGVGAVHQFKPLIADAPNSFEYHVSGGIDFPMGKGLMLYIDGGWMWANNHITITADGRENFGTATPNGETTIKYPETGTPVSFFSGGLVDFGRYGYYDNPNDNQPGRVYPYDPPEDPCDGRVLGPRDGIADIGQYYIQGGTVSYNGSWFGLGIRYQW